MKLLLLLFLALFMVLVFLYCCKKLGVDVGDLMKRTSNEPQLQMQHVPLHQSYDIQYQMMGNMLWDCLRMLNINEFDISSNIIGEIFCQKPRNRVKVYSRSLTFYYEIPLATSSGIRDSKIRVADFDWKKVEEILHENLPEYMRNGFLYSGVYVYSGEDNHAIIEIYGVGRSQPSVEGIII